MINDLTIKCIHTDLVTLEHDMHTYYLNDTLRA